MTLPEDQRSLSVEEQRAQGLSPAKMWLNLGGAVGALTQWTRRAPEETKLAGSDKGNHARRGGGDAGARAARRLRSWTPRLQQVSATRRLGAYVKLVVAIGRKGVRHPPRW